MSDEIKNPDEERKDGESVTRTLILPSDKRPSSAPPPANGDKKREPERPPRDATPMRSAARAASGERSSWSWIPLALFVVGTLAVLLTESSLGYVWDESYYYEPAHKAARWLERAIEFDGVFDRESIDRYWKERSEHPSMQKFLSGVSLRLFEEAVDPLTALRIPMALLFGATLALLFLLGRRAWGPTAGVAAAAAFAAMPRIFAHAHFATIEPVLMFGVVAVAYCFVRGTEQRGWAVAAGIALGLLFATKINAFFLVPPLVLWGYLYARRTAIDVFFFCIVLSPIVFVLAWPWLWPDPVGRVLDYLKFHAEHQVTAVWFMGRKWGYGDEGAPWFYPSVMVAVATPLTVLGFATFGLIRSLLRFRSSGLPILFLLIGLTTWAVASAPGVPKYDGVRLFLPLFPFLALLAGGGVDGVARFVSLVVKNEETRRRTARWAGMALVLILFAEGLFATAGSYPYLLSYFNPAVGGIAGARDLGFETTYWGDVLNDSALEVLNDPEVIPPNASIRVLALHEKNFQHLQSWKKLRPDIRIGGPPPYYAHLLLWRRGFFNRPERALADSPLFREIHGWELDGVPLMTLHRTGAEFEQYWPRLPVDGGILPVETNVRNDRTTDTLNR